MTNNIVPFPIIPLNRAHDVTETDLAARIRMGIVPRREIEERAAMREGFKDWLQRQGLHVWKRGVLGHD